MKENNKEQERFVAYITKQQCVNEAASVTDFLRKYAFRYHNSAFISSEGRYRNKRFSDGLSEFRCSSSNTEGSGEAGCCHAA